jgi:hypothetical protein
MRDVQRTTFTMYPLWMVWLGRFLLYFGLVMAPAAIASWLGEQIPSSLQPAGKVAVNVVLLPLLFAGLYWLLWRAGSRAQNFIWLVAFLFGLMAVMQTRQAMATGDISRWVGALLCTVYTVGYGALALWGWRRNRRNEEHHYAAARQSQIDLHAEAILRAEELKRERGG